MQPLKRFKTPKNFLKEINTYVKHCKEEEQPITITGFALFAGITKNNLHRSYRDNEEYADIYLLLMAYAEDDLINNALKGNYNAQIAKMMLAVNHGMKETVEIQTTQNTFSINTSAAKLLPGINED